MSEQNPAAEAVREPLLNPVDRITEFLFGLLMALSFVGAVSVAETGAEEIHELFVAAVGCNLAWGLVDGVMYIIRTITDRGRTLTLLRSVREAPDAATGRGHIDRSLSKVAAGLLSAAEVEAARLRILALARAALERSVRRSGGFRDRGGVDLSGRAAFRLHGRRRHGEEHVARDCAGVAVLRRPRTWAVRGL